MDIGLGIHGARLHGIELDRGGKGCMGTVPIFLNPATKILKQDVGICTLYSAQPTSVYPNALLTPCMPSPMSI